MRLLYLMHIPWRWIKQRPHFFAEALARDFDVDVFYKKALRAKKVHLRSEEKQGFKISSFLVLPFDRIPLVGKWAVCDYFNSFLLWLQLPRIKTYDVVWVTSIMMYHYVSPLISDRQKVVYDCMDDELEFPSVKNNAVLRDKILKAERKLLKRANVVFCSATYLKNKVVKRSGADASKFVLLNNAIQMPQKEEGVTVSGQVQEKLNFVSSLPNVFMYVGTIAAWFDFDLLLSMLSDNPAAHVVLIGPNEVEIPLHERIHHLGTVDRKYIFPFMEKADCLIMPFVVNELIRSVNPVKLYEYVYANKPVVAPAYEETKQFEPYVYLYSDGGEFQRLCASIASHCLTQKSTDSENLEFVRNNVWGKRYDIIKSKIQSL